MLQHRRSVVSPFVEVSVYPGSCAVQHSGDWHIVETPGRGADEHDLDAVDFPASASALGFCGYQFNLCCGLAGRSS